MNESKQDKGLENMETLVIWTPIDFLLNRFVTQQNKNVTHRGFFRLNPARDSNLELFNILFFAPKH